MTNLRVAVRIRPFSPTEVINDSTSILDWHSNDTIALKKLVATKKTPSHQNETFTDIEENGMARLFTFDNCFWSGHTSYLCNQASQLTIFETIGAQMIETLFDGINTSVLAYGQSGTGKTYTMMGTESDPGLAPRLCLTIFEKINANNASKYTSKSYFRVEVSFMEIYNEKVRDLLDEQNPTGEKKAPVGLRIREHPKRGPYVEGLKRHAVTNGQEALKLLHCGMQRRMIAATQANSHSSRSHAIFTIYFTAAHISGSDVPREITAKLNVVDLAGSERTHRDNANRVRLKEGALINRSLATLGNVINALAEKSSCSSAGFNLIPRLSDSSLASSVSVESFPSASSANCSPRRRPPFVPYRNSVLTWILKDSLGGNARTFLVAAVSPYSGAYKETLSTLRFAQRAKLVINRPVANEEASATLVRHLKNEVLRLKTLLSQMVDSKESMNDSLTSTEIIMEDSIKVRLPSTFDITEQPMQGFDKIDAYIEAPAAKELRDASVQTLLSLTNEQSVDESESSSGEGFYESAITGVRLSGIRKMANRTEAYGSVKSTLDDYLFLNSKKETKRVNSATMTSSRPLQAYYCMEKRDAAKSPTPPRTFKQLHRPKKIDRKRPTNSQTPSFIRKSPSPYSTNEKCCVNGETNAEDCTIPRRLELAWTEVSRAAIPANVLKIMKNVQLQSPRIEGAEMKRKCTCSCACASCSTKENPLNLASCSCTILSKDVEETCLRDFRSSIRQELLAIRRRLVARTASPQVAKALPFLKEAYFCNAEN